MALLDPLPRLRVSRGLGEVEGVALPDAVPLVEGVEVRVVVCVRVPLLEVVAEAEGEEVRVALFVGVREEEGVGVGEGVDFPPTPPPAAPREGDALPLRLAMAIPREGEGG